MFWWNLIRIYSDGGRICFLTARKDVLLQMKNRGIKKECWLYQISLVFEISRNDIQLLINPDQGSTYMRMIFLTLSEQKDKC